MIYPAASNSEELAEILAQTESAPRHIWVNGSETIVYTGTDIPATPEPEPAQ